MLQSNQRQVNLILLGTLQSSAVTCMHALPNWYYTPTAPRTCVEYIVHLCTIHSMLPNCTQGADSLPFWGTGLLGRTMPTMWLVALWSNHSEMKKQEACNNFHISNSNGIWRKKYGEAVIRLYGRLATSLLPKDVIAPTFHPSALGFFGNTMHFLLLAIFEPNLRNTDAMFFFDKKLFYIAPHPRFRTNGELSDILSFKILRRLLAIWPFYCQMLNTRPPCQ